MQLNIKNEEAYRIAKELANRTGESLTEAVTKALRERLEREESARRGRPDDKTARIDRIREILHRVDRLPVFDDREPDEIIGYDENGLPSR